MRFVSIPERVLEALKLKLGISSRKSSRVSIPERVLEALKLFKAYTTVKSAIVSIPERVLEALKPPLLYSFGRLPLCFNP